MQPQQGAREGSSRLVRQSSPAPKLCARHPPSIPTPRSQEVRPKTKLGLSAQLDALDLNKAPRVGLAYDLKY